MIDIPGIYVGRFKDDPNQSTMLMKNGDTLTYTDDNWANVESTGTIWRYSSEAGEWIDTGLEVMIGGTVEEYPVVDTELDYWMDKCVDYMNSNGNIGG